MGNIKITEIDLGDDAILSENLKNPSCGSRFILQ